MNIPTKEQIVAGNKVASELISASTQKSMHGLGGCKEFNVKNFKYKDIVQLYIDDKIDSVTGIWLAMEDAAVK